MSSYWSAITGLALHLNNKETESFFHEYLGKTYDPNHDKNINIPEMLGKMGTNELAFISSETRKEAMKTLKTFEDCSDSNKIAKFAETSRNSIFFIDNYLSDEYEGALFYTLKPNTKPEYIHDRYVITELDDGILIFGKSVLPQDILTGESYKSIEDIYEYFRKRLADYLPNDFDYESHIGFFQAAIYG